MRRIIVLSAFVLVLVGGGAMTSAQTETQEDQAEVSASACGTPAATPVATLDMEPPASPSLALASTPAGVLMASPIVCATPELATPGVVTGIH